MRSGLTTDLGVRITIEGDTTLPGVVSSGISAQVGTQTNIGLQMTNIRRLAEPYESNCTGKIQNPKIESVLMSNGLYSYCAKSCMSICALIDIMTNCHCYSPMHLEGILLSEFDHFSLGKKPCNVSQNSVDATCISNYHQGIKAIQTSCDCNSECFDEMYKVSAMFSFIFLKLLLIISVYFTILLHAKIISQLYLITYKVQISGTNWPSSGLWPVLIDRYGLSYQSMPFDAEQYDQYLMRDPNDNQGENATVVEKLQDYVSSNLLKVIFQLLQYTLMIFFMFKLQYYSCMQFGIVF